MQTFLAYPDFEEALLVLDPKRLGNQVYREGLTLIRGGWPHHPASLMWRGHEHALARYCLAGLDVLLHVYNRDYPHHRAIFEQYLEQFPNTGMPPWLGSLIRAILITPGDPDQIAIARLICDETGLDIPICAGKADRSKLSSGSIHHAMLKKYDRPLEAKPDGLGKDFLSDLEGNDLFIIGPLTSVGAYLQDKPAANFGRATMQGGFCPYDLHRPKVVLDKFEGLEYVATFNLNGERKRAIHFLHAINFSRRMVGKNICHTVHFNGDRFGKFAAPPNRAAELFCEGAKLLLNHHGGKKFHDPTAAVCHLHPEIGTWMKGKTVKKESGWTTITMGLFGIDNYDDILVDLDYEAMWEYLGNWK